MFRCDANWQAMTRLRDGDGGGSATSNPRALAVSAFRTAAIATWNRE
jgi:hypothetical protein